MFDFPFEKQKFPRNPNVMIIILQQMIIPQTQAIIFLLMAYCLILPVSASLNFMLDGQDKKIPDFCLDFLKVVDFLKVLATVFPPNTTPFKCGNII